MNYQNLVSVLSAEGASADNTDLGFDKYILLDVLLCSIAEYFYELGRILASP